MFASNSGKRIDAEVASAFLTKQGSAFSFSLLAKRAFNKLVGLTWKKHVAHRWSSLAEVVELVMTNFPKVEEFVRTFNNSDGKRNKICERLQVSHYITLARRQCVVGGAWREPCFL